MVVAESVLDGMKEKINDNYLTPTDRPQPFVSEPAAPEKVIKSYECMFVFWRRLDTQGLFIHAYDPIQAAKIFMFNRLIVADMADGPELRDDAAVAVRESGSTEWLNYDVIVELDQLFKVTPGK